MTLSKIICRASSCPVNSCGKESSCQCKRCEFTPWARKIPWRRKWQPIPVFLPGKSSEERSLAGYISWGQKRVRHGLMNKQNNVIFRSFDLDIPSKEEMRKGERGKVWCHELILILRVPEWNRWKLCWASNAQSWMSPEEPTGGTVSLEVPWGR